MPETKMGVITYSSKIKFLIGQVYNIFVTNERLIFSYISKDAKKETERRLNEKVAGKSFKERLEIISKHTYEIPEKYETMTPEEILVDHPKNHTISLEDIIEVKIKIPMTKDEKGWMKSGEFHVKTKHEKFLLSPVTESAMQLFKSVLKEREKFK